MRLGSPAALRRSLVRLRGRGQALGVVELAQELLALRAPPARELARQVVGAALGASPAELPERIEARHLRPAEEAELADVALEWARFAVVDLETTGLAVERSSILEIGAVRIVGLERTERFASLLRPAGRIPGAITRLTGIRDQHVVDAPTPRRALARFRAWLRQGAPAPLVAHNASFDARFLARGFEVHGLPAYQAPLLCTQRLSRRLLPGLGRYDLDHVCAHFGIANAGRHRGPGDADAAARVLIELLGIARCERGIASLGELLDLQERPVARRRGRRPLR